MPSILYGLLAALGWGAADFSGGLASKGSSPHRVILLGEVVGLTVLLIPALITHEPPPPLSAILWSSTASIIGTTGLIVLYRALATGKMSLAAPVSAMLAGVVPILVGMFTQGIPSLLTFFGFGLALASIWFISQDGNPFESRVFITKDLRLPLLAGIGFGLYFVLMHRAGQEAIFWALVSARAAGTIYLIFYSLVVKGPLLPERKDWKLSVLSGILDVTGNAFFIFAGRAGRMDVAAILSSLYPAATVLLAYLVLKERVKPIQVGGILLALGAIALMTI